jgi:NAD(P)-dependent dehydrogenase (short-subunit alcohol dehydrogenase family)
MKKNNSKKTILITGGSSGIGMNLIKFFLKKNYKIINISRSKPKITNKNLTNIKFDLTRFNKYDQLFKKIYKNAKKINCFIHSAGVHDLKPIGLFNEKTISKSLDINLKAPILMTKYLSQKKRFIKLNSIVFISSVMGVVGAPGQSVYSATKSGLIGLTRSLASELSKIKIKVNCVSPGVIKESRLFKQYSSKITKETIEQVKQSHPLGLGTFKDVNNAVNFLISEHSEWFTGQNFILDGGYSSQ